MSRPLCAALLVALAAALAPAADDGPVTFTLYMPKVGDRSRHTDISNDTQRIVTVRDGARDEKVEQKVKTVVYVEEVLAVGDKERKPVRTRRTYERAEEAVGGKTEKLPLHGLTAVIERTGGEYTFTDGDGKKLPAAAEAALRNDFGRGDHDGIPGKVIPRRPLKVGENWKMDTDFLMKEFGADQFVVDKKSAAASGTLARAYTFGGHRHGEFDLTFTMPVTHLKGVDGPTLKAGSVMKVHLNFEGNVDGAEPSGTLNGRITMVVLLDVPGGGLVSMRGDLAMTTTTVKLPPDKRN